MEKEQIFTYLVIFDIPNKALEDAIKRLEQLPNVQIWKVENGTISIGKVPNIFKAIPLSDKFMYKNGWFIIKIHEKTLPTKNIFVICDAKDKPVVDQILKEASANMPRVRIKVVKD